MNITVKCYANLSADNGCNYRQPTSYELPENTAVKEMLTQIDFADAEVHSVFVNGRKAGPGAILSDGDRIGLFPAVGGM
jgi:sulfur carrier protein ThiS